jgi:3-methylfumaryl-CoA hydratase
MDIDIARLRTWIGRSETRSDVVTAAPPAALAATLDRADAPAAPGRALPPLWHWLFFLTAARQSELGPDGHPHRGGFLPPVALPRRMWAGGQLGFPGDLRVGDRVQRMSTVEDVTLREGRTGKLVFVRVRHDITGPRGPAVTEAHDIVYRDAPAPSDRAPSPTPAPCPALWQRAIVPDDVLLFRYSALTFNGHRIHYDRRYATEVEFYPGLVVHGPLVATLLLDLVGRYSTARVESFSFRAIRPLFDTAPFQLCGAPAAAGKIALWSEDSAGAVTMLAEAVMA